MLSSFLCVLYKKYSLNTHFDCLNIHAWTSFLLIDVFLLAGGVKKNTSRLSSPTELVFICRLGAAAPPAVCWTARVPCMASALVFKVGRGEKTGCISLTWA